MNAADFIARLDTLLTGTDLSGSERDDMRLRVLVDYLASPGPMNGAARAALYATLARLIRRASAGALARVSVRIASHADLPPELAACLLARGGVAAAAVLRHAATIGSEALAAAAGGSDPTLAAAVAARQPLDPALVASLFRRPEREVLLALVENPSVTLERTTAGWLMSRARHDDGLARALLARGPLAFDTGALFLAASREERAAIIVAARRRELAQAPEFRVPAPDDLNRALEGAWAREDRVALIETLAQWFGLGRDEASRLVEDPGGEVLALMLNVAGVAAPLARRLLAWPVALTPDDRRLDTLARLQSDFASQTARGLLAAITGRAVPARAAFRERRASNRAERPRSAQAHPSAGELRVRRL